MDIPAIPPAGPEDAARRRRQRRRQESRTDSALLQLDEAIGPKSDGQKTTESNQDNSLLESALNLGSAPTASSSTAPSPHVHVLQSFAAFPQSASAPSRVYNPVASRPSAESLPFDLLDVHSGKAFAHNPPDKHAFTPSHLNQPPDNTLHSMASQRHSGSGGPSDRQTRFIALSSSLSFDSKDHESAFEKSDHFGFVNELFKGKS